MAELSDLEITKRCAKAMGIELVEINPAGFSQPIAPYVVQRVGGEYRPLHDDAQAMGLVKRLKLNLQEPAYAAGNSWHVWKKDGVAPGGVDPDLNRAICLCVAQLQAGSR